VQNLCFCVSYVGKSDQLQNLCRLKKQNFKIAFSCFLPNSFFIGKQSVFLLTFLSSSDKVQNGLPLDSPSTSSSLILFNQPHFYAKAQSQKRNANEKKWEKDLGSLC
jgi:hypothetical protein